MISAAYAMLGFELADGELKLRADAFQPKGELRLESVTYRGKIFRAEGAAKIT
jgi:cyclic beta-1,2-glucan synthetase